MVKNIFLSLLEDLGLVFRTHMLIYSHLQHQGTQALLFTSVNTRNMYSALVQAIHTHFKRERSGSNPSTREAERQVSEFEISLIYIVSFMTAIVRPCVEKRGGGKRLKRKETGYRSSAITECQQQLEASLAAGVFFFPLREEIFQALRWIQLLNCSKMEKKKTVVTGKPATHTWNWSYIRGF